MNTIQTIKVRKSPETFLSTSLDRDDIQTIVEAGNYAPIFGKVHFTVITDAALLDAINRITIEMMKNSGNEFAEKLANTPGYSAVRNAQTFVVLSAPGGNDEMGFNMANVSCAAENMILAATELGIGSRFMMGPVMSLTQEPVQSRLALPDGYEPLVVVAIGYADSALEERNKSIDNISYV